jgi:hypothetical protein
VSLRVLFLALLVPAVAHAGPKPAPAPAPEPEDATDATEPPDDAGPVEVPDARALLKDDDDGDDIQIDLSPAKPAIPAAPTLDLDPGTALPLSGVRDPVVVAATSEAVVVEQPVYIARTRRDTEAGFLLVTTFSVGGTKEAEVRQVVQSQSLAATTATWAFPKATVPVTAPSGTVTVQVATAALDGTEVTPLFTKTVAWHLAD